MQVTLTMRAVSGYWEPQVQTAYTNTDLEINLNDNGQIKNKAVLYFNEAAFLFDENNRVTIPANRLKETNSCIVQDKNEAGNVIREWRHIETLHFDLEKLDKAGEKHMLAEREFFKEIKERFAELAKVYEESKTLTKSLAAEVVKQGKVISEMQKDIEALKNEPVI